MEFRVGSPAAAEAIAGLIATSSVNSPTIRLARVLKSSLPPCLSRPSAITWPQSATDTFSLTRVLNWPASSPSEMAPTFFTSLSSAHISAKALAGSCGSKPCANCARVHAS